MGEFLATILALAVSPYFYAVLLLDVVLRDSDLQAYTSLYPTLPHPTTPDLTPYPRPQTARPHAPLHLTLPHPTPPQAPNRRPPGPTSPYST